MLTEDNIRRGMTPEQARRAALIRMGGPAIHQGAASRRSAGCPVVEAVLQDLRFAFRLIAKDRWFSAAVIVALALGIGANTVGFTIVNAAFLRGLPFEEADRLYVLSWQNRAGRRANVSQRRASGLARPEPQLRRPRGVSRRDDEHQRRPRAAGAGARHVAHRQRVRRAQAAAAARP